MIIVLVFLFWVAIFFTANQILSPKKTHIVFLAFIIILIILESIRNNSGVDFSMYYNSFKYDAVMSNRFEFLYATLEDLIRKFTNNYNIFLLIITTFTYSLYYFIFKKNFFYPIVALYFLYVYNIGMLGSNRQIIATVLCFLALHILSNPEIKWRKIIFILLIGIACNFHITAIFFIVVLFLDKKINIKLWMVIILIIFSLNFQDFNLQIVNFLKNFLPLDLENRLTSYLSEKKNGDIFIFLLGIVRRILPIFILTKYRSIFEYRKNYNLIYNIVCFSLLIYSFCFFNFSFFTSRLPYFLFVEIFVYTWWIEESFIRNYKYKNYSLFLLLLLGFMFFYKNISQYLDLFIPYNTIFN